MSASIAPRHAAPVPHDDGAPVTTATSPRPPAMPRRWRWMAAAVTALALSACGGGYADGTVGIDVVVSGQVVNGWVAPMGGVERVNLRVGQSVQLDAGEPVVWTMLAGGSAFPGNLTIYYGGAYITQTLVGSRRLLVDTSAPGLLVAGVPVRFTAVSTYDGALVTTVDVVISN